jgi:cardiolipin synthase
MGLPNWLTILRIVLIPVYVTLLVYRRPVAALAVFCLASVTDLLDGWIARHRGIQSRLGAFLDPVADKLLLTSAYVTLTYLKMIPFWLTAVVVSRDFILSAGVLVIHVAGGTIHPAPSRLGKASTALQMVTVLAAMLFHGVLEPGGGSPVPRLLGYLTALFTIASGLQYIAQGLRQIGPAPAAAGRAGRGRGGAV